RLENAVHTVVIRCQAELLQKVERRGWQRPDFCNIVFALCGQVSLGEGFKSIASLLFVGKRGNTLLEVGEALQARKKSLPDECHRLWMTCARHLTRMWKPV